MSRTQNLSWLLTADDRASQVFKGVATSLGGVQDKTNAVKQALTALGATAAVGYLGHMAKASIDLADSLDELSQVTGITASNLSAIRYAAESTGPGFDVVTTGLEGMFKAMGNAIGGNKELEAAFASVGVSMADLKTKSPDEILYKAADGFAAMKDGAAQADTAAKIFGKGVASDMIPWLNQGSTALRALAEEARAAGLVISDEFATQAGELNDNLAKLRMQSELLGVEIGTSLVPRINDAASALLGAKQAGEGWFSAMVDGVGAAMHGREVQLEVKIQKLKETIAEAKAAGSGSLSWYAKNPTAIGSSVADYTKQNEQVLAATEAQLKALRDAKSTAFLPKPKPTAAGTFYEPPKTASSASAVSKADPFAVARASDDASVRREQATYEARTALLKQFLSDGSMSYQDYYDGLANAEEAFFEASRRKIEAEQGRQSKIATTGNAAEREQALAKQVELAAELDSLESEYGAKAQARAAEQNAAQTALNSRLSDYYIQFLEVSGQEAKAAELKATAQFAEIERLARINGLSTEYIDHLKGMAVAVARLDAAQKDLDLARRAVDLEELKAQGATKAGTIGQYELEKRLVQIRKDGAKAMLSQAEAALKLAQATGDKAKIAEIEATIQQLRNTMNEIDGIQAVFWSSMEGRTQTALEGILNGTTSIMDGVKGVMTGVLQDINAEVSRELASMVRKWLFDAAAGKAQALGGSAGGGWIDTAVSWAGSLFGARAAGGSASGLTLVGENGPELAYMGQGGHVYNNARTQQMLAQRASPGGAPQVVVNIQAKDAASFKRSEGQIAGMLSNAVRRGARNS